VAALASPQWGTPSVAVDSLVYMDHLCWLAEDSAANDVSYFGGFVKHSG
jgi:hypothetical protein